MKAKELMIGDWIYRQTFNGLQPRKIRRINPEDSEEYKPIPLTPDILEKNGFVLYDDGLRRYFKADDSNCCGCFVSAWYYEETHRISIVKETSHDPQTQVKMECRYVHELQHIMRLCGIDKEITL